MITTETRPRDVAIESSDGLLLHAYYWPRPDPRGVLIISHGFGEYGGAYRHVAEALGPAVEVDVLAIDFRGHGRSPGRRGVVRDYNDQVRDLRAALAWVGRERPGRPRYILGHSNGAQVALRLALADVSAVDGLVLTNPALRVHEPIPPYKLAIGKLLRYTAPWVTLEAKIQPERLTRDPAMQRAHEADPLRHSRMSAPLFFGMVDGGPLIVDRAPEIRVPTLMILGADDPVIDPKPSRQAFERLGSEDKSLIVYPDMLHEPLNELSREQVFADIIRWLDLALPPSGGAAPPSAD